MNNVLEKWQPHERLWLFLAPTIATICSLIAHDCWYSIVSSVSGILFMILCAKGKWQGFLFGILHAVMYSIISYENQLYGDVFMNTVYGIPMMLGSMILWKKNTCQHSQEVIHCNLDNWHKFLDAFVILGLTYVIGNFLYEVGDTHPYSDAFTTICAIYGAFFMLKRYAEMWLLILAVNVVSIYVWGSKFIETGEHLATVIMWMTYVVSALWGWRRWDKI